MCKSTLIVTVLLLLLITPSWAQRGVYPLARDTIIRQPTFPQSSYLLQGKELDLSVMEWFMRDIPNAHDQIRIAIASDQLSVAGYGMGGLLVLSSLALSEEDESLSRDLGRFGLYGIASGLAFQFIANGYQRNAVRTYNTIIKNNYRRGKRDGQVLLQWHGAGMALTLRW